MSFLIVQSSRQIKARLHRASIPCSALLLPHTRIEFAPPPQQKLEAKAQPAEAAKDGQPSEEPKKYNPLPILKQHATNVGYVTRVLATDPKQIAKLELKRWLKKQTFDRAHLDTFVHALKQPDWSSAIAIIDRLYDQDQSWINRIPASFLAELTQKKCASADELEDILIIISYRVALEDNVLVSSQLLNSAIQASLSFGNLIVSKDLVNYSISFSIEIARVELEKLSLQPPPPPPDPSLALRPLTAVIAGLMTTQSTAARHRTPIFRFLSQLIKTLIHLCGSLESVFNRISKPNRHLICRAIIYSIFSPDGHTIKPIELDQILKQNLPISTLRLAMIAMIHIGNRTRANQIEALIRRTKTDDDVSNSKFELDLALHQVRRCKIRAYSSSEKFHHRFLSHLPSIEAQPSGASIETYTSYMSALFRHHLPKMALQVWERIVAKGIVPDAAAIQVAMTIYIDLGRPLEAVRLFDRYAFNSEVEDPYFNANFIQDNNLIGSNPQVLATYVRALDLSERYSKVYEIWKISQNDWGLQPDSRIFATLISSARKLTHRSMTPVTNAMLRSTDPGSNVTGATEETYWDGELAGKVVIQLFWTILYENWASIAESVRAPNISGSSWTSPGIRTHVRLFEKLLGLNSLPSSSVVQLRSKNERFSQQTELARTIIPSLKFQTRWSTIIPNRSSFKDMIELLGMNDQADMIPLLLNWMKSIDIKPNQDLLTRAYYWIYRSSSTTHRLIGLDEFTRTWIHDVNNYHQQEDNYLEEDEEDVQPEAVDSNPDDDDNDDYKMATSRMLSIPTEEMIQTHHLERVKWSNRIYFSKTSN